MTEHKYTDEEVIKSLKVCLEGDNCKECYINPHHGNYGYCTSLALKAALDLINRKKAAVSALMSAVDNSTQEFLKLHDKYQDQRAEVAFWMDAAENAKKEAVKEFAEKLKKECLFDRGYEIFQDGTIDHLVKEFTEEKT